MIGVGNTMPCMSEGETHIQTPRELGRDSRFGNIKETKLGYYCFNAPNVSNINTRLIFANKKIADLKDTQDASTVSQEIGLRQKGL